MLAMEIGFMGPNFSISTACATGNYCIMSAANDIRSGRADIMLAGAADAAIIPSGIGGFIACKVRAAKEGSSNQAVIVLCDRGAACYPRLLPGSLRTFRREAPYRYLTTERRQPAA